MKTPRSDHLGVFLGELYEITITLFRLPTLYHNYKKIKTPRSANRGVSFAYNWKVLNFISIISQVNKNFNLTPLRSVLLRSNLRYLLLLF